MIRNKNTLAGKSPYLAELDGDLFLADQEDRLNLKNVEEKLSRVRASLNSDGKICQTENDGQTGIDE